MAKPDRNLDNLDPEFREKLEQVLERCAFMQLWEGLRGNERQAILFDRGTSKAGPGQSPHNYGMAADCVLDPDHVANLPTRMHKGVAYPSLWYTGSEEHRALWHLFGKTAQEFGLVWGGSWGPLKNGLGWDPPHIELADWRQRVGR